MTDSPALAALGLPIVPAPALDPYLIPRMLIEAETDEPITDQHLPGTPPPTRGEPL